VHLAQALVERRDVLAAARQRERRAVEAAGRRAAEYAFDLTLGQNVRVSTRLQG